MPTKEDVETYDALIALQYSGLHFRSQMKALAKRSRNKAVGRVLKSSPQRITVFMDELNNPGIKIDAVELFTLYPTGILWHPQDASKNIEFSAVTLIREIIDNCTDAEWDTGGGYYWRGYNSTFAQLNIQADNIDERVFLDSGILQHTPRPNSRNGVAAKDFTVVDIGEHWKGRGYYNRRPEDRIIQDHAGCEICELGQRLAQLLTEESTKTDEYMLSKGGGSLANERWFPFKKDMDPKFVPTIIKSGMKTMKKA
jgi:hypothetical protein